MDRRQIRKFEGFVWVGIGIGICLISWQFGLGSLAEPGSGFIGFVSGLFLVGVGLVMVLPRSLSKISPLNGSVSDSTFSISSWPRLVYTVALLLAYGLLLDILGYIVTTFLVMWGLFYDRNKRNWVSSCFVSLISVGATYLVFKVWLLCQFPLGIFP